MKIALTIWNGRISPVFDVSREALILTIENATVATRCRECIEEPTAARKVCRLMELGVETLICGAISERLHQELITRGVQVVGFVAGDIEEVVQAFVAGKLPSPSLAMPGCCGKQNRFQGGKGQSQGQRQGRGQVRGQGRGRGCGQGRRQKGR